MRTPCIACKNLASQPSSTEPHHRQTLVSPTPLPRPTPAGIHTYQCSMCGTSMTRNTNYQDAAASWSLIALPG